MSKEQFLIQVIQGALVDLGYLRVAGILNSEVQKKDDSIDCSIKNESLVSYPPIVSGANLGPLTEDELYKQIVSDPSNEDHLAFIRLLIYGDAENIRFRTLDRTRLVLCMYYLQRLKFLSTVIDLSLGGDNQTDQLLRFLKEEMLSLLDGLNTNLHNSLSKEKELAILLPLLMQSPISPESLPTAIFSPNVLLVEPEMAHLAASTVQKSIASQTLVRETINRNLHWILSNQIAPLFGKKPEMPGVPHNFLERLIYQAALYQRTISTYFLPPRNPEKPFGEWLVMSAFHRRGALLSEAETLQDISHNLQVDLDAYYKESFPDELLYSLQDHTDEVWFARFLPSGRFLVTGSLDGKLIIYDVTTEFQVLATIELDESQEAEAIAPHSSGNVRRSEPKQRAIIYCSWDLTESYLVSCGLDTMVRVWDVTAVTHPVGKITLSMSERRASARLVLCFTLGENIRTWTCEFFPLGYRIVVGSPDKHLKVFDLYGNEQYDFFIDSEDVTLDEETSTSSANATSTVLDTLHHSRSDSPLGIGSHSARTSFTRVSDVSITPDGKYLIAANNDKLIVFYSVPDLDSANPKLNILAQITLSGKLTLCSTSSDGKYVLISVSPDQHQVWDISQLSITGKPILKCKYIGHRLGQYIIRLTFGYSNINGGGEELVLSGSEEGYAYLWKLHTGQLITRVKAHHGLCNSVDWNRGYRPKKSGKDHGLLWCSVGDDHLVNIWGPKGWKDSISNM